MNEQAEQRSKKVEWDQHNLQDQDEGREDGNDEVESCDPGRQMLIVTSCLRTWASTYVWLHTSGIVESR